MKKKVSVLAIFAFLVGVMSVNLSAGIFDGLFGSKTDKKANSKVTTLKMWIMPNSTEPKKDLDKILKKFEEENNVKVEVTVLDWGSAWNKITTAATSGIGPDLIQLGTTWVPTIAAMDVLLDLKPSLSKDEQKAFLPAAWAYRGIQGSGQISTIPWFSDIRPLYYRKDVLAKAGLDPKTAFATWASFKETCRKINGMTIDGKKIYAFGHPGKNDWNVPHFAAPWIWGAGGAYLNSDGTKALLDTKKSIAGINFYTSFVREGLVPKEMIEKNTAEVEAAFRHGEVAMIFTGPWIAKAVIDNRTGKKPEEKGEYLDQIGVAIPPKGPAGRYTFFGGSNLGVFNFTKNKDLSIKLVKYLTLQVNTQIAYAKATGNFPPLIAAGKDKFITGNPEYMTIKKAAKYGRAYPAVASWGPMETILMKRIGTVWSIVSGVEKPYDEKDVIKELKAAQSEMETIISQTGN